MYRDDWFQAAGFVLLAAIGALAGYRATLPTHEFLALGPAVASSSAHPATVATSAVQSGQPAAATTPPQVPAAIPDGSAQAPDAEPTEQSSIAEAVAQNAGQSVPTPGVISADAQPAPNTQVASLPPTAAAAPPGDPLQTAANAGDSHAQYALALAFKFGRGGVAADSQQSLTWMRRAAQGGLPAAARTLGIAYEEGASVEKDLTEAAKWYTRAALGGDLQGMHNLAYFFTQGAGGMPRDGTQAEHWFRLAAEHGLTASQINLAILCSQGDQWGIETRLSESYFWSGVAAQRGDAQAKRMHDVFAKVFAPGEKAKLDAKIAAFKPKPIDVIANGGFDVAPEAFLPPSSRPGLTDAEMTTTRQMLTSLGYTSVDEKAIRDFQGTYSLPVTGKADRQLLAALKSIPH